MHGTSPSTPGRGSILIRQSSESSLEESPFSGSPIFERELLREDVFKFAVMHILGAAAFYAFSVMMTRMWVPLLWTSYYEASGHTYRLSNNTDRMYLCLQILVFPAALLSIQCMFKVFIVVALTRRCSPSLAFFPISAISFRISR